MRRRFTGLMLRGRRKPLLDQCIGLLAPSDNHQLALWRTLLRISSESCSFCTARASTEPPINASDWKIVSYGAPYTAEEQVGVTPMPSPAKK
jgi:hypothetical protein